MEPPFTAFTQLEQRLEKTRKQKSKLGHEFGAGRACLTCGDKCVGGLNLHFWRKICVNCKCKKEAHDLLPEDYSEVDDVFEVLGVKIPEHKNLVKYSLRNSHTLASSSKPAQGNVQQVVEWIPPIADNSESDASDDHKRNEKINKYFKDLGEDAIPFKNSEAALKRKEQAQIQIPPHDFKAEHCDNLSEFETQQLKKYVDSVKKNFLGQGQIDVVPEKPVSTMNIPSTNPFVRQQQQHDDMNRLNNNNLIVSDMLGNLSLNEETKLNCRGCNSLITSAYVKAERLGKDAHWHPKCFKCNKCSQLLVDLIYFHFKNEIYCARDLADLMEIPRCTACDELILVPEYTLADEKNYHLKHFCCVFCDIPLAGQQYVNDEKTNNPVCLECYDKHFANFCTMCQSIIAPSDEGVSFNNFHFHLNCFKCGNSSCAKKLIGSRFCMRNKNGNNIPFCSSTCVNSPN